MKIFLGTHHLEIRAGSELFTQELAHAFRQHGHDVGVFTFFKGAIAELIEADGIPVFDPDTRKGIVRFAPDIVHTAHHPCAHYLRAVLPEAVRVHTMLGTVPVLERPPLDATAYSLGLALSEEVLDHIKKSDFGQKVDLRLLRNWFDDKAVVAAPEFASPHCMRVVVVSNHVAPQLRESLASLEKDGRVMADYFGIEGRSVVIDGNLLTQYDLVISIGRTVPFAAACGLPCIMADVHGSDGLLTSDTLDLVRTKNFSGRVSRLPITRSHLEEQISRISAHDLARLRDKVLADYSLQQRIEWLLARYKELLAEKGEIKLATGENSSLPPGEGISYSDLTATVRKLRRQLAIERSKAMTMNGNSSPSDNHEKRHFLRLDELAGAEVISEPYPHLILKGALAGTDELNADFPPPEGFGPTIRMDGDLTAGDSGYDELLARSPSYRSLHEEIYSREFIATFLRLFETEIRRAYHRGELLEDPFALDIVAEPVEKRISGYSFVGGAKSFLYPRFDIGYGGLGYGLQNGGRGIHIDNLPRLISIMVFLNTPRAMSGGTHRLYRLCKNRPELSKVYQPKAGLLIASLQSNRAFHDVEPISAIEGQRRALYIAVSCSKPIWKKEAHRELSALSKNRYDSVPRSTFFEKLQRLTSKRR